MWRMKLATLVIFPLDSKNREDAEGGSGKKQLSRLIRNYVASELDGRGEEVIKPLDGFSDRLYLEQNFGF